MGPSADWRGMPPHPNPGRRLRPYLLTSRLPAPGLLANWRVSHLPLPSPLSRRSLPNPVPGQRPARRPPCRRPSPGGTRPAKLVTPTRAPRPRRSANWRISQLLTSSRPTRRVLPCSRAAGLRHDACPFPSPAPERWPQPAPPAASRLARVSGSDAHRAARQTGPTPPPRQLAPSPPRPARPPLTGPRRATGGPLARA